MRKITTDDGSVTFYNEKYQDVYHTKSGAIEESFEKFVKPCKIEELASKGRVSILDVCFGLGYNTGAAIDVILKKNPDCKITVYALENDPEIISLIKDLNPPLKNYCIIEDLAKDKEFKTNNIHLKLLMGDARETIKTITQKFDAVFLDPFSPAKQPDLWQTEFFADIKKLMNKGGILTTYSYARMVKDNLKDAGFIVSDGPIIGRRSPSTIAQNP